MNVEVWHQGGFLQWLPDGRAIRKLEVLQSLQIGSLLLKKVPSGRLARAQETMQNTFEAAQRARVGLERSARACKTRYRWRNVSVDLFVQFE